MIKTGNETAIAQEIDNLGADIFFTQRWSNGVTPLQLAASENQVSMVRYMLSAGANPNIHDNFGVTPLSTAVGRATNIDLIRALLDVSDIFATNQHMTTILHVAASCGNLDAVNLILSMHSSNFALINARNAQKWSAIDIAANSNHVNSALIIRKLVEYGATLEIHNLTQAAYVGNNEAIQAIFDLQPALLNETDLQGRTCLHYVYLGLKDAVISEDSNVVELLDSLGAKSYHDLNGQMPEDLMY
jgi:ankyrin repeat protein